MRNFAAFIMLGGVAACSAGTSPDRAKTGPAAHIAFLNAPATAKVNSVVQVTVHVADANSVAVSGQVVNFVVVSGGGRVFAGSALTSSAGDAKEIWTFGPAAGVQRLEARAVDQARGAPLLLASLDVTAQPTAAFISIHLLDQLDTTTAPGRSLWVINLLVYSKDPNQTGIAYQGNEGFADVRLGHSSRCSNYGVDSLGQRQVIVLALADTLHMTQADADANVLARQWYSGNRNLPPGWMALRSDSVDWAVSAQRDAGHGYVASDPIRWLITWSGKATVSRAEAPTDNVCS